MASVDATWNASVQQTSDLLSHLQTYLASKNIPLIVLHIPSVDDIQSPGQTYTTFERIGTDLGLHRLDILDRLSVDDVMRAKNWTELQLV